MKKELTTFIETFFIVEDIPAFARAHVIVTALDIIAKEAKIPIERFDFSNFSEDLVELLKNSATRLLLAIARWPQAKNMQTLAMLSILLEMSQEYSNANMDEGRDENAYLM